MSTKYYNYKRTIKAKTRSEAEASCNSSYTHTVNVFYMPNESQPYVETYSEDCKLE